MKPKFQLKTKIIGLVCGVIGIVLVVTSLLISRSIALEVRASLGRQALSVARIVAHSPIVINGLAEKAAGDDIQKFASETAGLSNVQFIVVLDMNSIRKSHPVPSLIGRHLVGGDEKPAMQGNEYLSEALGTMGYSLRAFTPVYGPDGQQIGVVLVGILMHYVDDAVTQAKTDLLYAMVLGMAIGVLGAILLARDIKQTLFGLEPEVIAKRLEERNVMLQSVREAIIAVDRLGHITLLNDEGRRLLQLSGDMSDPLGHYISDFVPQSHMLEVLSTGKVEINRQIDFFGVSVLANCVPLLVNGNIVGAIATFRDKTEVKRLAEELTGVRDYVDALRSQSHEFMNQLHVILGMVQLESYDLLSSYIRRIADDHHAEVTYVGRRIRNPVLAGFVLSKLSLARERNIAMQLASDSYLPSTNNEDITHELVTIIGNLVENAFDAVAYMPSGEVYLGVTWHDSLVNIIVTDNGAGVSPQLNEKIFEMGVTTKNGERGFGLHLVKASVTRVGGKISFLRKEDKTIFNVCLPYESAGENE